MLGFYVWLVKAVFYTNMQRKLINSVEFSTVKELDCANQKLKQYVMRC